MPLKGRARTSAAWALAAVLILAPLPRPEAQAGSVDEFASRAQEQIAGRNFEEAVRTLSEAKKRYPLAPRLNIILADLYYEKELYTLALDEYREAEAKGNREDFFTLDQIARCYGKLNREADSIGYLTRILELYPDSVDCVDDLAWMYFKTHQLEKGESLLLEAKERFGPLKDLAMTLGTIYSGMNEYEKARQEYRLSIEEALRGGDDYFASIAYYNLSLLEHNFYRFNSALRYTDESIAKSDRAPGHLARGELYQSRMDYRMAAEEYQKAFAKDTTPLTKVNLAVLMREFGFLDLARRYAEEVMGTKDLAWMLYYGTDLTRHYKDIHEILADAYEGMARVEAMKPTAGPLSRISALWNSVKYRAVSSWHRLRFRLLSVSVGKSYLAENSLADAWWEFFMANEAYPEVALKYLGLARAEETSYNPHTSYFYLQEEGRIRGSADLLEQSLSGFDPFWEKEAVADSLRRLAPLLPGPENAVRRREVLARLFEINPGALRQDGLGLPLALAFSEGMGGREKALIVRYMKRAGSEIAEAGQEADFPFLLSIRGQPGEEWSFSLTEPATGRSLAAGRVDPKAEGTGKAACAALVRTFLDEAYAVR